MFYFGPVLDLLIFLVNTACLSCPGLKQSSSESSLYKAVKEEEAATATPSGPASRASCRRWLAMSGKPIGCSLSLPRKIGAYHVVQRNAAFVSEISASRSGYSGRSGSPHSSCPWDSGVSSFSEQSSFSDSSPPCSMGIYRDPDILEERSHENRSRRLRRSFFRSDRYSHRRRMRQPYTIPFRMCQSMNEDSTASLHDFLSTMNLGQSQETTVTTVTTPPPFSSTPLSPSRSPQPGLSAIGGSGSPGTVLKRSQSIDNLELSKLRLAESSVAGPVRPSLLARSRDTLEVEQVAAYLKNFHFSQ